MCWRTDTEKESEAEMRAIEIYEGSNGEATKALYDKLQTIGPLGIVAANLFRAQKASSRAKEYSRRFKGTAYDKKNWSMGNLVDALLVHGGNLGIGFGWKLDPKASFHEWVLYVELPNGQVSFHSAARGQGPDYAGDWDGSGLSAQRIVTWVQTVLDEHFPPTEAAGRTETETDRKA